MPAPMVQPSRKAAKVRQACDCCHSRKIRCDGVNPCLNCQNTGLQCTYLAIPKKKGPKGRRVPKEAPKRSIQQPFSIPQSIASQMHQTHLPDASNSSQSTPEVVEPILPLMVDAFGDPEIGFHQFQSSPLVTEDLMRCCLDAFFIHKYPIMPILDKDQIYALLPQVHLCPEQYALVISCCAIVVLSPEIISSSLSLLGISPDLVPSSEFLVEEAIRARQFCNYIETPSLSTVQTSFFFFAALFCQDKDNSAWFYIREAMTMIQILRLHEENTYFNMDLSSAIYARRTFWLLFITERAYALQRHRPVTLQRTIKLPTVDPGPEATILSGFLDLVSLFQNFDDDFISVWNLSSTSSDASPGSLMRLQHILKLAIPNVSQRTEIQQADLLISRQWLKTMVWQLCVTKGLLSSNSNDESMSFHFPVTISRDVVLISRLLPPAAFEANGVGILEKVFDIGCSLSDILLLSKSGINEPSGMEIGPRDYLMEMVRIMGTVLGGSSKYLHLLAAKADECLQVRVQGSLSSNEDPHRIHEIDDDEEFTEGIICSGNDSIGSMNFEHPLTRGAAMLQYKGFGPEVPLDFNTTISHYGQDQGPGIANEAASGFCDFPSPKWDNVLDMEGEGFERNLE